MPTKIKRKFLKLSALPVSEEDKARMEAWADMRDRDGDSVEVNGEFYAGELPPECPNPRLSVEGYWRREGYEYGYE